MFRLLTNQLKHHKITLLWRKEEGECVGQEGETREKLIASGRKEFLEKGYAKASLRQICADAGVTTGALYFTFDGKEDLFRAIVEPPLEALVSMLRAHFAEEKRMLLRSELYVHREGDHDAVAERFIRHLYGNYDAFILLLTKSQGTAFESSLERIVELIEEQFVMQCGLFAERTSGRQMDAGMLRWMVYMTVDAFVYLLTHEPEEQAAIERMKLMMNFIVKGFVEMILSPERADVSL